jgi:hypothetical protein
MVMIAVFDRKLKRPEIWLARSAMKNTPFCPMDTGQFLIERLIFLGFSDALKGLWRFTQKICHGKTH